MSEIKNLTEQTKLQVLRWLLNKQIQGGEKVPANYDFARKLGVSPMTLANALKDLERDGIVTRIPRRGTFLNNPLSPPRLSMSAARSNSAKY